MDFIKWGDASFFISYVLVAFAFVDAFFVITVFPMRIGSNDMPV
jgi:hypothetical protein